MIKEMLPDDIKLEFEDGELEGHYLTTPYAFNPRLGHKLVPSDYVDLGQGLLIASPNKLIAQSKKSVCIPNETRFLAGCIF